jgi:hypothetical protein
MWFKSDISIYDRDDFKLAWEECDCLSNVWEWIQRESIKQESGTIRIKNSLYLRATLKRLRVSEPQFRDAQKLLGELELIIFDDPNEITLPNWLSNQGLYFAKKQAESSRKAEYREKKKQETGQVVPGTYSGQGKDVPGKSVIREDKIREEKIREDKINKYIPDFSENETDLTDESVESSKFSGVSNFPTPNTESLNQEIQPLKSQNSFSQPKENGSFDGELIEIKQTGKIKTDGSLVFEAYSQAIENLYKTKPLRNSKTNAQCKQLVDRLGLENALRVVEFYVNSKDSFYLKMAHSLDWCVKNAESLFLQCESGIVINASKARKIEAKLEEKEAFEIYESRGQPQGVDMKAYLEKKYQKN